MKKTLSVLSLLFLIPASAQEGEKQEGSATPPPISLFYNVGFDFLLDNLEESSPYWDTRTLFAAKLTPQIGLNFDNQNLSLGGYFILNMGEKYPLQGAMILFYDTQIDGFKGYLGSFTKQNQIGEYSDLFFRKDYDFYHPLNHGFMLQYQTSKEQSHYFKGEIIGDWYSGDLAKRIDEFLVQGSLKETLLDEKLYIGSSFLLYHTKNDEFLNADGGNFDTFLLDRFYYHIYVGSNLTPFLPSLDKLDFQIGTLSSLERKRRLSTGLDPFSHLLGWQFDFQIQYQGFGVENSLYYGDSQFKYFKEYGEDFYAGNPFYQSSFYNRLEVYYEYKISYLKLRAGVSFHFTNQGVANQEQFSLVLDTHKLLSAIKIK